MVLVELTEEAACTGTADAAPDIQPKLSEFSSKETLKKIDLRRRNALLL